MSDIDENEVTCRYCGKGSHHLVKIINVLFDRLNKNVFSLELFFLFIQMLYTFQTESPLYYTVMALHIMPPEKWKLQRVKFLERLLVLAHIRNTVAIGGTRCVLTRFDLISSFLCPKYMYTAGVVLGKSEGVNQLF